MLIDLPYERGDRQICVVLHLNLFYELFCIGLRLQLSVPSLTDLLTSYNLTIIGILSFFSCLLGIILKTVKRLVHPLEAALIAGSLNQELGHFHLHPGTLYPLLPR